MGVGKSVVAIAKSDNVQDMVEEVFALLGGVETLIKPGSTVVLKPNAGHPAPAQSSVNTSPQVLAAVARTVRRARPGKIVLAESAAIGCDTVDCLEVSGLLAAAREAGVDDVRDIKREEDLITIPIRDAVSDVRRVQLPRFLLEAEHIINMPIFKSHAGMVFTGALKNIKGTVQDRVHYQMHQTATWPPR